MAGKRTTGTSNGVAGRKQDADAEGSLNLVRGFKIEECRATLQASNLILPGVVEAGQLLRIETTYLVENVEFKGRSMTRNHICVPMDVTLLEVLDPPQAPTF